MRIQHNIMAMNAYRNYNNNTSALSKNLEKLSSGYKINRAGDDAAGLAISEKMRAQITGLDVAQKNAKDGISLVKTAEGALSEVHDMLNRMVELANQSANGTYENETDRVQLQKEIEQLKTEIDRIADSANFNGIKLLDGTLSSEGPSNVAAQEAFANIKGTLAASLVDVAATTSSTKLLAPSIDTTNANASFQAGDTITVDMVLSDGTKFETTLTASADKSGNLIFKNENDESIYTINKAGTNLDLKGGTNAKKFIGEAVAAALNKSELGKTYEATAGNDGEITFASMAGGADKAVITTIDVTYKDASGRTQLSNNANSFGIDQTTANAPTKGTNATQAIGLGKATVWNGKDIKDLEKSVFEIGGKKFVFFDPANTTTNLTGAEKEAALKAMEDAGITFIKVAANATAPANDNIKELAEKLSSMTGLEFKAGSYTAGAFTDGAGNYLMVVNSKGTNANGGGLTLQIGDTSEDFNQLNVSIKDCHVESLGLKGIDISTQKGAQDAVAVIKNAINYVSDVRGTLGATQNRLDHTINNLSVMEENIQDAESTIRDTDVADEMMAYTKNNILIQSAQAMLAQANQVPQGVLQLLQ